MLTLYTHLHNLGERQSNCIYQLCDCEFLQTMDHRAKINIGFLVSQNARTPTQRVLVFN